jgi:transcriptional antiterminator RfaH
MSWYVLRSRPNAEERAFQQVRACGFEAYYPRLRAARVNPRARAFRPFFPGYLFVEADLARVGLSVFQYMPHSTGLVCFGGEAAPVPAEVIQGMRRRMSKLAAEGASLADGFGRGERLTIVEGPFAGWGAVFDRRLSGQERVRVLLELLSGRQLPVELSASQISRQRRA